MSGVVDVRKVKAGETKCKSKFLMVILITVASPFGKNMYC